MKSWLHVFVLFVVLALAASSSGRVSSGTGSLFVSTAYAQSTPGGLSKLESKVNDIAALIQKILYVFVGVGILFCGFRFIQGDPHAWRYTLTVVVGATIIFASGEILTWLQR